jgi:hypothetical protein
MTRITSTTVTRLRASGLAVALLAAAAAGALAVARIGTARDAAASGAAPADAAASRAAFLAAYPVFMHPRCLNCHPAGDAPLQGEDSRVHAQNVRRGPTGHGMYAMKCASCHQDANVPGESMPPGNAGWHLPHPRIPLVFEGLSPRELAMQLKDPTRNGGRSLEQLLRHVQEDGLVLWGWNPGEGRTKPPASHAEFVQHVREWIEQGAAIPE